MGRLYNVTPPCPYCGEEHICWTIRLTDREQEILAIDDQIRNIKLEINYFKLLQAEKGDK